MFKYLFEDKEVKMPRILWVGNVFLVVCGILYTIS